MLVADYRTGDDIQMPLPEDFVELEFVAMALAAPGAGVVFSRNFLLILNELNFFG